MVDFVFEESSSRPMCSETQKSVGFEAGAGEGRLNELCLGW